VESQQNPPGAASWPQPHPSPPLPPPPEYGSPGSSPDRSWIWLVLGGAVVLAVAVVAGLSLLTTDGDDEPSSTVSTAVEAPTTAAAADASGTTTPTTAPIRCWDGTGEQALDDCSLPEGSTGLSWLFPHLAEQKCGSPSHSGPGVELRVICIARLSDGSPIRLGYYQWESVRAGIEFYDGQQLERSEDKGFHRWAGGDGDTLKSALLYVEAPYSLTVTLPSDAVASSADLAVLSPRPPGQLRGEPVG
jgi:hypothetical protein